MNLIRSFLIAFSMYSRIPVPGTDWNREAMKYSMCFFPLIGVVIGAFVLFWDWAARALACNGLLYGVGLVLIPVAVTGGIHLDGLLDTADAISSYKTREERLEILKDSHAGAFAIIVGISYFLLYVGVASEAAAENIPVLAVGFVLSRALSGFSIVSFRMAKNTGLAATFSDMALKTRVRVVMVLYVLCCGALMVYLNPRSGLWGLLGAGGAFVCYRRMSYRIFGGITGDLAGFFLQICELAITVFVIGAQMIWR